MVACHGTVKAVRRKNNYVVERSTKLKCYELLINKFAIPPQG